MRFLVPLAWIVVVSLAVTASADEGQAIAEDLTELRQQLGSPLQAGPQIFQRAVRDVAKEEQNRDQRPQETRRRPHHHRRPQPTPATRLRETAFQLDRLAHELEMAELYEGADTLRDTAEKLRRSARQAGTVQGGSTTPPALAPHHHP